MELWEMFVIAVGLSMDAFAIAICKGLSVEKIEKKAFGDYWTMVRRSTGIDAASGLSAGNRFPVRH